VHNPETQLEEIEPGAFLKRLRSAFEFLEFAVATGKIRTYGTATWYAYLGAPKSRSFLSMADIVGCARDIAGDDHHFSVIQMPYNLSMREACATRNQQVDGKSRTPLEAAADLGLTVMASASTFQARLTRDLPPAVSRYLEGLETDSQRAIQFVRSTPGITTALVGMSQERHVEENLRLIGVATASADAIRTLLDAA
jgi:aryl-alcohol dehydrogenase-like predicted oxidoreductase